jgi:alkylation response protein AidB-like acyl-CoA dehydrogenase
MSAVRLDPSSRRTEAGTIAGLDAVVAAVEERAAAVDRGASDVRPALRELGAAGLLALGTPAQPGDLTDQAEVIRTLARSCMSTAFSAWAQRMAIGYLSAWGTEELRTSLLPQLVTGARTGATAMATAFQDALGLREVSVTAREQDGEVVLDGMIPWASNLFADGAVVVLPARTVDGRRLIVAVTTDVAGVQLPAYPPLLALGTTASTSMKLEGVRIPAAWVLTDRFLDFLADVRPSFLLLQTAFCLGIADAALDGATGRFTGPAVVLEADHDALLARRDDLAADHARLLARGGPADEATVRLRLHAGRLGVDATRHEAGVRGGAGYLAGSPVARRLREAAFLPIQSPTEAQLRWELTRSA